MFAVESARSSLRERKTRRVQHDILLSLIGSLARDEQWQSQLDGERTLRYLAVRDGGRSSRAQETVGPVIGFLSSADSASLEKPVAAFRQGLDHNGFIEGRNVAVTYRWAKNQYDQLPALAQDLVRQGVSVIVTSGGEPAAFAAKAATKTIPIVFNTNSDPV
jgi:ABC transporter substrate binding protein